MTKSDMAVSKVFSARFLMSIMLTGTACAGFLLGKINDELFLPLVSACVTAYFMRRPDETVVEKKNVPGA
jgi:hypothetical protein